VAADHPLLADYTADGYTAALEQIIQSAQPEAVVFPHTYQVRDYGPKLATRFGKAFVSDVVDVKAEKQRTPFGAAALPRKAERGCEGCGPAAIYLRAGGSFSRRQPSAAGSAIEPFVVTLEPEQIRGKPEAPFREAQRSVDLSAAEVIVSVGRGHQREREFGGGGGSCQGVGAELAASRPICDNAGYLWSGRLAVPGKPLRRRYILQLDLRSHSAPGRHEGLEDYRGHQQGRERADLRER